MLSFASPALPIVAVTPARGSGPHTGPAHQPGTATGDDEPVVGGDPAADNRLEKER